MKFLLTAAYLFLLGVLLPHTAWMFSIFEPPEMKGLGWAAAIAFEITIAVLTHFLAKQIAIVSTIDKTLGGRLKEELANIPSLLLLAAIAISAVANWTHAVNFASRDAFQSFEFQIVNDVVRTIYAILFGGILPVCSFAYAYVLSTVYKRQNLVAGTGALTEEEEAWLVLLDMPANGKVKPSQLATEAKVPEEVAAKVITRASRVL